MTVARLTHIFTDTFPDQLDPGTVYVSIPYATVAHLCCCGCGNQAVTPLGPTEWKLTFDGESVSLCPSVGNWSFPCRSHYWIRNNTVRWARSWSDKEIAAHRAAGTGDDNASRPPAAATGEDPIRQSFIPRLRSALRRMTRSPRSRSSQGNSE